MADMYLIANLYFFIIRWICCFWVDRQHPWCSILSALYKESLVMLPQVQQRLWDERKQQKQ